MRVILFFITAFAIGSTAMAADSWFDRQREIVQKEMRERQRRFVVGAAEGMECAWSLRHRVCVCTYVSGRTATMIALPKRTQMNCRYGSVNVK